VVDEEMRATWESNKSSNLWSWKTRGPCRAPGRAPCGRRTGVEEASTWWSGATWRSRGVQEQQDDHLVVRSSRVRSWWSGAAGRAPGGPRRAEEHLGELIVYLVVRSS
jgi:hypothetical protein